VVHDNRTGAVGFMFQIRDTVPGDRMDVPLRMRLSCLLHGEIVFATLLPVQAKPQYLFFNSRKKEVISCRKEMEQVRWQQAP
jgi:hypothetical protein